MNKMYYGITQLIKSAITEKSVTLPDDFDWKTAIDTAVLHKIEVLVYYGAYYSNINIPKEYKSILEKCVLTQLNLDVQQEYEIAKLCKAFDDKNITYMPLKGTLIKKIYPKSEMRYMGDADILIKPDEYQKIKTTMTELGYTFSVESNHEYIWRKQNICIELHKRLIPSYNKDYYRYYGDGWQLARLVDGKYKMSDEDFYIYLFTHLAKHYRDSGVGIKQFVDLWVYLNSDLLLDHNYIDTELEQLQLLEFHKNCINLLKQWFGDAKETEITKHMTQFIFTSGVYGSKKTGELSAALKNTLEMKSTKNLKLKLYMRRIFLPYKLMKKRYSVLKYLPVLLPLMWIVRIFNVLLFKRDAIKTNAESLNNLTNESIDTYSNMLHYVGLDFNFKEKK